MLNCENLSKAFDEILFSDFNLQLTLGNRCHHRPSGCGKTTLLRGICGLEEFDSGSITLDGLDITTFEAENRKIGLIFQKPVLYPHLDVAGNLKLGNKNGDISKALKEVNLEGFAERKVETLSGGEGKELPWQEHSS